jgi:hypothetical protein
MVESPKRVGAESRPETCQLLEEERDALLFTELSHSLGPSEVHFSPTGLRELGAPICFRVPNILGPRPALAPDDYPPESRQIKATCNVFEKRLRRKEPHRFLVYGNLAQRVHFVERLRASDTDTQPDVRPPIAPIFR